MFDTSKKNFQERYLNIRGLNDEYIGMSYVSLRLGISKWSGMDFQLGIQGEISLRFSFFISKW